jgi:hypothetical protein
MFVPPVGKADEASSIEKRSRIPATDLLPSRAAAEARLVADLLREVDGHDLNWPIPGRVLGERDVDVETVHLYPAVVTASCHAHRAVVEDTPDEDRIATCLSEDLPAQKPRCKTATGL